MQVKKAGGKIFGANLTAAERKAMQIEIQKEIAEYDRKNLIEMDAIILWELHKQLGFGYKRLKQFYDGFMPSMEALCKRYEMEDCDQVWLATYKLKEECGVDLEQWEKENRKQVNDNGK